MTQTIVGVDPGYRNLGLVILQRDEKSQKCKLVRKMHIDIGPCQRQEEIIAKLWSVLDIEKPFLNADYVVIENQLMGKHTNPTNQGLAWLLATMAMNQAPHAAFSFLNSKSKFSTFKDIELRYKISSKIEQGEKGRRAKIKTNSIYLATQLLSDHDINPNEVFEQGKNNTWEHLADAVGLAFVVIKKLC